jgi:hypothetical protein
MYGNTLSNTKHNTSNYHYTIKYNIKITKKKLTFQEGFDLDTFVRSSMSIRFALLLANAAIASTTSVSSRLQNLSMACNICWT